MAAPSPPPPAYLRTIRGIDKFTEYSAYLFCLLNIPLIGANTWEVISRYGFGEPTEWALDTTTQSYGAMFMLGAAYALSKGAHVRTDMLWEAFSDRTKGLIDSAGYILFFLPTMAVLFWISLDDFFYSMSINERSNTTSWQPIIWPLRGVIPLSCLLLFIQGISELLKSLWAARTGQYLVHQEKLEL
jgi:TRAP-type mannitol/chloroaromatic compound transport system permease small subunit